MNPIITPNQLLEAVQTNAIVLVDATNSPLAYQNYQESHLKGALFVDVNTQLADIKEDVAKGGRHPLPTAEQFSKTLTDLGIVPETWVVVYDDKNGANAAARFWWMLRSIGHEKVQILSGGIQAAIQAEFPISPRSTSPCFPGFLGQRSSYRKYRAGCGWSGGGTVEPQNSRTVEPQNRRTVEPQNRRKTLIQN